MARLTTLLLFMLLFIGCAEPKNAPEDINLQQNQSGAKCLQDTCLYLFWQQTPEALKLLSAQVVIVNKNLSLTTESIESIYLWMPSMGHGSSPIKIKSIDPSNLKLDEIYFLMAGDWELRIKLKDINEEFVWSYYF
ncbi:MAG: hypothetical protein ACLGGX_09910 [Bdellovibrionia bacterium]